ncbi:MAG: HAD family hydrolase [Nanoarchaeota archaeon]|nr:HAD family hydrolase [Nanoarchaeota archaeon]
MKNIKAVLFDFDGVLIDSHDAWWKTFNDTYKHFMGKSMTKEDFSKKVWGSSFVKLHKVHFPGVELKDIIEYAYKKLPLYFKEVKCIDNADLVIPELKKKYKLGIVTNARREVVEALLPRLPFEFDSVVTFTDVKEAKPAPEMILKACKEVGVRPEEAVVVGDFELDLEAARRAGSVAIGYKIPGDFSINDLKELIPLLRGEKDGPI